MSEGKLTAKKHMGILRNIEKFPVRASRTSCTLDCNHPFITPLGLAAGRPSVYVQTFVEWLEDLIGARDGPRLDGTAPTGPPASVRALVDNAYRRIADALLSHLLDAELDRSNSEEKGQRHAHVFIAGTLHRTGACSRPGVS